MFTGCGDTNTTSTLSSQTINKQTPKIRLHVASTEVTPNETILVEADVSGDIISYQWWDEKGDLLGTTASTIWTAPSQAGHYTLTLTVRDEAGKPTYKSIEFTVRGTIPSITRDNTTFDAIHAIITQANQGLIFDATYICVGDSTRADSKYEGEYLFYQLQDKLRQYNITSHLLARAGHLAREFNDGSAYPSWENVVSNIPDDGDHTIVDISLGINDYWDHNAFSIAYNIKSAINKIRAQKPKTHFVLTMPNRVYGDNEMTNFLKDTYKSLSKELQIPLNNVIDDVMPTQSSTPYSWYRDDGFHVHLSRTGQAVIAQYLLANMLP